MRGAKKEVKNVVCCDSAFRQQAGMGVNASAPAPTALGSQLDGARVRVAVKERYYNFLPKYINRHATVSEEKVRLAAHHWNFIADEV